ncbi:MAG: hypothetical protein QF389_07470, partial [Planctomycetota bacterium]|nr:hypothetical protein [Planctomycetota bacterium]
GKTFFLGSVEYPTAAGINDADGDSVTFDINFPDTLSFPSHCHTLASESGTGPTDIGISVPLTSDTLFLSTYAGNYLKGDWIAPLSPTGTTSFTLQSQPGKAVAWIGKTLYFAFVAHSGLHNPSAVPTFSTSVVTLRFVP